MVRSLAVLTATVLAAFAGGMPSHAQPEPEIRIGRKAIPAAVAAIDQARSSLDASLYKFDEPNLLAAVERALKRGVRVRIVADEANAKPRSLVGLAEQAGAEVRRWPLGQGKLHAKLMILDGERAVTGSFNWTRSAARSNVELLIDFREPGTVKRLAQAFESLWDRARPSR